MRLVCKWMGHKPAKTKNSKIVSMVTGVPHHACLRCHEPVPLPYLKPRLSALHVFSYGVMAGMITGPALSLIGRHLFKLMGFVL